MTEKIVSICDSDVEGYDGVVITTDRQKIQLLIEDQQECCEIWGYIMSEDDPQLFVGSTLMDIKLVDAALNTYDLPVGDDSGDRDLHLLFVNLHTDLGVLQFVAYNCHNGYYGHDVRVISKELTHSTIL